MRKKYLFSLLIKLIFDVQSFLKFSILKTLSKIHRIVESILLLPRILDCVDFAQINCLVLHENLGAICYSQKYWRPDLLPFLKPV